MAPTSYEHDLEERRRRQADLDAIVSAAMKRVTESIRAREPALHGSFFYGASAIHPRHLVTWYLFGTDADWDAAKRSGLVTEIERRTRAELAAGGYPAEGVNEIMVSFTSDEEIQREAGGDYWAYFK